MREFVMTVVEICAGLRNAPARPPEYRLRILTADGEVVVKVRLPT